MYESLTKKQIEQLSQQQCTAANWNSIKVSKNANINRIENVRFHGNVLIGESAVIQFAKLEDVEIGDNVIIEQVGLIQHYKIGNDVQIKRVNELRGKYGDVCGKIYANVLNECGGRAIGLTRYLTAPIAFLWTLFRERKTLMSELNKMMKRELELLEKSTPYIADKTVIQNTNTIRSTWIDCEVCIDGVTRLEGCIVGECAKIGYGVNAVNTVFQASCYVDNGVCLKNVFVGRECVLNAGFVAEHSLFFAGSHFSAGEAVSVLAGPLSASHHRSSLLIAQSVSFYNAGSGTNASNHAYKTGPIHQGIFDRGCKTGSNSYVRFPAHIGAVTTILGSHSGRFNTKCFPFSLLVENNGESMLLPAALLFGYGIYRDERKFHKRLSSKAMQADCVITDLYNPYTIGQIETGLIVLQSISPTRSLQELGINIPSMRLPIALDAYRRMLRYYCLEQFAKHCMRKFTAGDPFDSFLQSSGEKINDWIDLGGLVCPRSKLLELIEAIEQGKYAAFAELHHGVSELYQRYDDWTWEWVYSRIDNDIKGKSMDTITDLLFEWGNMKRSAILQMLSDGQKDFNDTARIGYGFGGDRDVEFEAVHEHCKQFGELEKQEFNESLKTVAAMIVSFGGNADSLLALRFE